MFVVVVCLDVPIFVTGEVSGDLGGSLCLVWRFKLHPRGVDKREECDMV